MALSDKVDLQVLHHLLEIHRQFEAASGRILRIAILRSRAIRRLERVEHDLVH